MKKAFSLVLAITFISALNLSAAGVHLDAKTWRGLQTSDVRTLSKDFKSHLGQLVMVTFTFRGKDIHHVKPNWYESSIWQQDPQGKKGFSNVRVMVAKGDLPAFKSITTNSASSPEITFYGRVLHEGETNFVFVRLLGRNAVVDPSGNALVTW